MPMAEAEIIKAHDPHDIRQQAVRQSLHELRLGPAYLDEVLPSCACACTRHAFPQLGDHLSEDEDRDSRVARAHYDGRQSRRLARHSLVIVARDGLRSSMDVYPEMWAAHDCMWCRGTGFTDSEVLVPVPCTCARMQYTRECGSCTGHPGERHPHSRGLRCRECEGRGVVTETAVALTVEETAAVDPGCEQCGGTGTVIGGIQA